MSASIGFEAQFLAFKLELMQRRWAHYMPLHELSGFDYEKWIARVDQWMQHIDSTCDYDLSEDFDEFTPSCEYLFDYYTLLHEEGKHFYDTHPDNPIKDDTKQFVQKVGQIITNQHINENLVWLNLPAAVANEELSHDLTEYYNTQHQGHLKTLDAAHRHIASLFTSLKNDEECLRCCMMALARLKAALEKLHEMTSGNLSPEMFQRLCVRQYYHLCTESHHKAIRQVNIWKNTWPNNKISECAQHEKHQAQAWLKSKWYGAELSDYIDLDKPEIENNVEFGRFLYKNGDKLGREDIRSIHYHCRLIIQLNMHILHRPTPPATPTTHGFDGKHKKDIWDKIVHLINKPNVSWVNITCKQVEHIMEMAMGLSKPLPDTKLQNLSETLWKLFTVRQNCNAERSHKVTWLNLAGYLCRLGYLGSKDPTICTEFYPHETGATYNNVQKGRKGTQENFRQIEPLLSYCVAQVMNAK